MVSTAHDTSTACYKIFSHSLQDWEADGRSEVDDEQVGWTLKKIEQPHNFLGTIKYYDCVILACASDCVNEINYVSALQLEVQS